MISHQAGLRGMGNEWAWEGWNSQRERGRKRERRGEAGRERERERAKQEVKLHSDGQKGNRNEREGASFLCVDVQMQVTVYQRKEPSRVAIVTKLDNRREQGLQEVSHTRTAF